MRPCAYAWSVCALSCHLVSVSPSFALWLHWNGIWHCSSYCSKPHPLAAPCSTYRLPQYTTVYHFLSLLLYFVFWAKQTSSLNPNFTLISTRTHFFSLMRSWLNMSWYHEQLWALTVCTSYFFYDTHFESFLSPSYFVVNAWSWIFRCRYILCGGSR